MRSSLKSASYIALSFVLWSSVEATEQDFPTTIPKNFSTQFSESQSKLAIIPGKRKRDSDHEETDQRDLKRIKLDEAKLAEYPNIPDDILNIIANFIEDPITFQAFKVVSKGWNKNASQEHYLIPSDSEKLIKWVLSFRHSQTMKFDTEALIKDFMVRNKRTPDSHTSLSFKSSEYTSAVPENLRLINDLFNDLSPIAKTLLEEIKLQKPISPSLFSNPENRELSQEKSHFKELLLKWQPYGIILHLNYFLNGDIRRGFRNIEKIAQNYPEISHFLLYPYDIDTYPHSVASAQQFNRQLQFLDIAEQFVRVEAFKAYRFNDENRLHSLCSSYLTTAEDTEEIKEPNIYPMLKKETKRLKAQIKRIIQAGQQEESLPYFMQIIKLYEAHTHKLKQKLLNYDPSSMDSFNIEMVYPLIVDLEDAQRKIGNVHHDLAHTYEELGKRNHKKDFYTAASQFYIEAAQSVMKYTDIMDSDEEYDWVSDLLKNAAEAIFPVNPTAANELRLKSEQAYVKELDTL